MPNISERNRREFLATSAAMLVAGPAGIAAVARAATGATTESPRPLSFGMVTYLWGRDLSLPELLVACEASGLEGLELRTTHRHGVERDLGAEERREILTLDDRKSLWTLAVNWGLVFASFALVGLSDGAWLLLTIPIALFGWMTWSAPVDLSPVALIVWLTVAVFGFNTAMTFFLTPHQALGAELEHEGEESEGEVQRAAEHAPQPPPSQTGRSAAFALRSSRTAS